MNNFCVMPWMHIHTRPDGNVSPCCIWDTSIPLGNIKKEKVINIVNQKEFKELRKSMLKNESLQGCIQCNEQELVTGQSYRSEFNNIFNRYIDDFIGNTNEDGSYDDFKMLHMNIRFSNLCNFGCRSCGSINSSFIGQEEKIKYPVINILDSLPNYKEEVFSFLKDVKWINFAGGESMLIKEHWEVLDKLIEIENFDTHITFVTNVSKLEYNQKSIITYAKKFKNLMIKCSIDSIGSQAEYYRYGTRWDIVENNLKTLRDENVNFAIQTTVGATNVFDIPETIKYLYSIGCLKKLFLHNLVDPFHLSSKILPIDFKNTIEPKLIDLIEWLRTKNISSMQCESLLSFMMSEDHSNLIPDFINYNKKLDHIRKQNLKDYFPDLAKSINY